MRISGFSFARNAGKLGYPIAESLKSILPICDEFVIVIGKGDSDDNTKDIVKNINSSKINIIESEWMNIEKLRSHIYSQQTNIALSNCSGDWCFYIQCDEVVHEKYLPLIREQCKKYLNIKRVEGFLFNYKHFWGDYDHYIINHKWYPREVRIVRNNIGVQSIGDAQSFKKGSKKLRVIQLDAEIFHYGWVRNPTLMQVRNYSVAITYKGKHTAKEMYNKKDAVFDYGSLENYCHYTDSYPQVMQAHISKMDWKDKLQYKGKSKVKFNHDRLRYKVLTFFEQKIFRGSGKEPWGYKNYKVVKI
jgi:glycosyltransferase involved in cell wall biosynthesis